MVIELPTNAEQLVRFAQDLVRLPSPSGQEGQVAASSRAHQKILQDGAPKRT